MAKVVKEDTEKYQINPTVLFDGYSAVIDGRQFAVSNGHIEKKKNFVTNKTTKVRIGGSVVEDGKETGLDYFTDLSPLQLHKLTQANVIILTETQGKEYNRKK